MRDYVTFLIDAMDLNDETNSRAKKNGVTTGTANGMSKIIQNDDVILRSCRFIVKCGGVKTVGNMLTPILSYWISSRDSNKKMNNDDNSSQHSTNTNSSAPRQNQEGAKSAQTGFLGLALGKRAPRNTTDNTATNSSSVGSANGRQKDGNAANDVKAVETGATKAGAAYSEIEDIREMLSGFQEENRALKVTLLTLNSEMNNVRVANNNEMNMIKREDEKLLEENEVHSLKISVLKSMLKKVTLMASITIIMTRTTKP
jgi:hypothetical protein